MSSAHSSQPSERDRLMEAVLKASGESSSMSVFFHSAIAEHVGIGATEEKALFLLSRYGPLTVGEIAHHTGLTMPSITSLVDRLEARGFVLRIRDTQDRRRVIVQRNEERLAELTQMFLSLQESFKDFLTVYNNSQLETIADFLTRASRRSQEFIAAQPWKNSKEDCISE